ncbi:MAG: isopentenyl-diphosphate Delta-isomerase [Pyrinomonadaceae bacterium]
MKEIIDEDRATSEPEEFIVFADDFGNAIGTGRKSESHNSDTYLHLAFSIFLFNSRGELLLQQRSFGKKTWPGAWSNSCCGHVGPGESVYDACARRLRYELGLVDIDLVVALPDFRYRAELNGIVENEICPVLIGFTDQEPKINPDEVESVRWIDWQKLVEKVENPASGISPWAVDEVKLLAASKLFRSEYAAKTNSIRGILRRTDKNNPEYSQ